MNKILGIMGASGLAREVLELARQINQVKKLWDDFVFIDINDSDEIIDGARILSYEAAKSKLGSNLQIAMGIGEPSKREKLFKDIRNDQIETPTLIHPDVHIPTSTTVGTGVVIQWGSFISCNASIKDYVYIQPQCNIGHDDILEEGCMLAGFSNLGGLVHIGRWTYLGLSSVIKQSVTIGEYSVIGMGAVVYKDIPDNTIAVGNPARNVGTNDDKKVFK